MTIVPAYQATVAERACALGRLQAHQILRQVGEEAQYGARHDLIGIFEVLSADRPISPCDIPTSFYARSVLDAASGGWLLVVPGWCWVGNYAATARHVEEAASPEDRVAAHVMAGRQELTFEGARYVVLPAVSWAEISEGGRFEVVPQDEAIATLRRMAVRAWSSQEKAAHSQAAAMLADTKKPSTQSGLFLVRRRVVVRDFASIEPATPSKIRTTEAARGLSDAQGRLCQRLNFDEQLRFVSAKGEALSNIKYKLKLANGETVDGTTDDQGRTKRIITFDPQEILCVDLFAPSGLRVCSPREEPGKPARTVQLTNTRTNSTNPGSSVQTVTLEDSHRPLTAGERAMAESIFKRSIDYYAAKIHNHGCLPFGLQNDYTAMTPNGQMYFNSPLYEQDYSVSSFYKALFIHEMTHVWQHQHGYHVQSNAIKLQIAFGFDYAAAYDYSKDVGNTSKTLPDFNMEQQAQIIEDYFSATYLNDAKFASRMPFFQQVLADFLRHPNNAALMPGGRPERFSLSP